MEQKQPTTVARNFIQQNLICRKADQKKQRKVLKFSKQLLQRILPQQKLPINLLNKNNLFVNFIKKQLQLHNQQFIDQFIFLYSNINQFALLKYGQYCGVSQEINKQFYQQYKDCSIVFSQHLIAYICLRNNQWKGFCYRVGKSAYIGQFKNDLKSDGLGKALFLQQKKSEEENNPTIIIYHTFQGKWKSGEIILGQRKTYFSNQQYTNNTPKIQYDGQFINFQFNGKGKFIKNNKIIQGTFQKGKLIKNHNKIKDQQLKNQSPNNSKVKNKDNGKSSSMKKESSKKKKIKNKNDGKQSSLKKQSVNSSILKNNKDGKQSSAIKNQSVNNSKLKNNNNGKQISQIKKESSQQIQKQQ